MINKNCQGKVSEPGNMTGDDEGFLGTAHGLIGQVRDAMEVQAFHEGLEAVWAMVRAANAYIDGQAPWKLAKEDPARMGTVLYLLAETIRHLAILTQPFMPDASAPIMR